MPHEDRFATRALFGTWKSASIPLEFLQNFRAFVVFVFHSSLIMASMTPRQFKALVEMLRTELASLRETVQQTASTISDQQIAHQRTQQEEGQKVEREIAGLYIPPDERRQNEANQERRHRQNLGVQKALILGTWLAFVTAAIYAAIAAYQSCQIRQQAIAAHDTLCEIQKQTALMRRQLAGTLGALIPQKSPFPNQLSNDPVERGFNGIALSFINLGKVDALDFRANVTLARKLLPNYTPIGKPQKQEISKPRIVPFERIGNIPSSIPGSVYSDQPGIKFDVSDFTDVDMRRLQNWQETIEISGYFEYDNGFGNKISEPICFLNYKPVRRVFADGTATGGEEAQWGFCEDIKHQIPEYAQHK
jgi:hypothetical protein